MFGDEFLGLRVERGDGSRSIVEIDGEAVGLIVVLHPTEDIVVDVAEEVDFGFHSPIISDIFQSRVLVEHTTIPAAHLVVRYHRPVLDFLLFQDFCGLVEKVGVDPVRDCPMLLWDDFCIGR